MAGKKAIAGGAKKQVRETEGGSVRPNRRIPGRRREEREAGSALWEGVTLS